MANSKRWLVLGLALTIVVLIITSCSLGTLDLPKKKTGPRSCTDSREGWLRCSSDHNLVEKCASGVWVAVQDCGASGETCNYTAGDVAVDNSTVDLGCVAGACTYENVSYMSGEQGCINETTLGVCDNGQVSFTDCALHGMVCEDGACVNSTIVDETEDNETLVNETTEETLVNETEDNETLVNETS
ncbi:MAG: hypothetical protein R6U32_07595 [Candidatus Woesearchaeota archaeon]